ncbi:hypothetical protein [Prevotella histicola]|uniref:Uncharacterized protein n=1 Tax=Prevotella histicola JCM 15637 = DNF00424 TaxID=1236504 RepID=A0AAW3FCY9_9BACT|nr:hypothetical protein [Prevotella histicola]KGF24899.1 hypothetical protein HMPREF2132_11485 [Prevotella histicola JCM 15637 = DNF00424]
MEKIIRERKHTIRQLFALVGGAGNYLHIKKGIYNKNSLAQERTRQNEIAHCAPGFNKFFIKSNIKEGYISIGQRY